jgi:hypothetical protein
LPTARPSIVLFSISRKVASVEVGGSVAPMLTRDGS